MRIDLSWDEVTLSFVSFRKAEFSSCEPWRQDSVDRFIRAYLFPPHDPAAAPSGVISGISFASLCAKMGEGITGFECLLRLKVVEVPTKKDTYFIENMELLSL